MSEVQDSIVEKIKFALQGEPLRAISYGATAVVWLVSNAAFSLGLTDIQPPTFDASIIAVGAAIASVTEFARRFVYSPVTVERVIDYAYNAGASREALPAEPADVAAEAKAAEPS